MGAAWRELQSLCSVMCMCLMPSSIDTEPFFQSIWKFTSDKFWWGMLVISLLFVEAITIRDGKGLEGKTVGEPCQIDDQEVFPAVLFLEKQTPGSWNVSDNDGSRTLQDRRRLAPQNHWGLSSFILQMIKKWIMTVCHFIFLWKCVIYFLLTS